MLVRQSFVSTIVLAVVFAISAQRSAEAINHDMQIEQVIGGVNGDKTAQAIQLRMQSAGQNIIMSGVVMRAFDAAGNNPVLLIDFPANVVSGAGRRILSCTSSFAAHTSPAAGCDFTLANPIPESYLNGGSITFEVSGTIYWRLSWGNYTGSNAGNTFNDSDGNFGPPEPGSLPSSTNQALLFPGAAGANSTNNAADYMTTAGAATFTNNALASFVVQGCTVPGDCNDGVACTDNACNAGTCVFTPNNANCDNGDICDGAETCHAKLGCQDGTNPPDGTPCPDAQFCNGEETCQSGVCSPGTPPCPGAARALCDEDADACVPAMSTVGASLMIGLVLAFGAAITRRRRRQAAA